MGDSNLREHLHVEAVGDQHRVLRDTRRALAVVRACRVRGRRRPVRLGAIWFLSIALAFAAAQKAVSFPMIGSLAVALKGLCPFLQRCSGVVHGINVRMENRYHVQEYEIRVVIIHVAQGYVLNAIPVSIREGAHVFSPCG